MRGAKRVEHRPDLANDPSGEPTPWTRESFNATIRSFETILSMCRREIDDSYETIDGARDQLKSSRQTLRPEATALEP